MRGAAGPATTAPAPLMSLAGLRFVAAFLVFCFHLHVMGLVDEGTVGRILSWLFSQGAGGFSFFFLVSGLVLTWSLRPDDSTAQFWRRRLARIYPNHVATWLVTLVLLMFAGTGLKAFVVLPNLFLVQAWLPDHRIFFGMNIVSWSLACELFFYALFPLLHRTLVRLPGRSLWPAAGVTLAATWAVPFIAQLLPHDHRYWAIWIFPPARLPEFLTGMLLARIIREGRWPAIAGVWPMTAVVVVAYVATGWLPIELRLVAGLALPLALLVGALAAADASGRAPRWCPRWLLWLGELSYAFYLIHHVVLRVVTHFAGTSHPLLAELAIAAASFVLALSASWLMYRYVERPCRRLLAPRRVAQPGVAQPGVAQPGASPAPAVHPVALENVS